ncbi:hypothetical protein PV963_21735 [Streptomyces coeruleorubidus]|uniref:hypothetical protein n=1 Tax=Streptomyces coeruleorubidus TaxID=116188 RepID=UPI00237F0D8F|nr:hypothetical protein [Streptomyces coeruleorubidus]WDV52809.1 hypothetical protein PV963_21735 [Streptomyces coeruleorubidus]
MSPERLGRGAAEVFTGRFFLVSYLPTLALSLFVLVLVRAGAPGERIDFGLAWRTTARLNAGELTLLVLAVTLAALVSHPLQLPLVRLMEGFWPAVLRPVSERCVRRQARRRSRLEADANRLDESMTDAELQAAGAAGTRLRQLFPPADRLLPTALGNALAATEHRAGAGYGWDAVVAWPRLYPLLGETLRAVVDDRRNTLDAAARLSATAFMAGAAATALLSRSGWWLLLALGPLALSWICYRQAVGATLRFGEAVESAFDLHRFDLLRALHLPLPAGRSQELAQAQEVCAYWRQGMPVAFAYEHGVEDRTGTTSDGVT